MNVLDRFVNMAVVGSMCLRNYRNFLHFSASNSNKRNLFNIVRRHICNIRGTPLTTVSKVRCHDLSRTGGHCVRSPGFTNTVSLDSCFRLGSVAGGLHRQQTSLYSTQKKDSDGGITGQILKSKLDELKTTGGPQEGQKQDTKSETGSDSKKDDKKESWMSSKHAWKLGLVSMAASGILIVGNLIYLWGKLFTLRNNWYIHKSASKQNKILLNIWLIGVNKMIQFEL